MIKFLFISIAILAFCFATQKPSYAGNFQEGIYAYTQQDYVKAERYFKKSLLENPDNLNLRYYLAIVLVRNKKIEEAKHHYMHIIKTDPNSEAAIKANQGLNLIGVTTNNAIKNTNFLNSNVKSVTLNISDHNTALIVNNVKINNKINANFILDTGATFTSISRSLAQRLGISLNNAQKINLLTANGPITVYKAMLDSIEINGLIANNVEVTVHDLNANRNIDGLLGLSFIQKFKVTIDKTNGTLTLEKS